jgi:hypothetical protein
MSSLLDLGGNEIYGLALTPNTEHTATSKKYVDDLMLTALTIFGGTMSGPINMGSKKKLI